MSVVVGAVLGAALGSKLLFWLQDLPWLAQHPTLDAWMSGKTIVGGLLGGWLGVELAKKNAGIASRSGDLFTKPLLAGIALGRVGCLAAGLSDDTYGIATSLPIGVDQGDGVPRHPVALYEIAFLALVYVLVLRLEARAPQAGDTFRAFLFAYLAFRLAVDALKPPHGGEAGHATLWGPFSAIQWACLLGLLYTLRDLPRIVRTLCRPRARTSSTTPRPPSAPSA